MIPRPDYIEQLDRWRDRDLIKVVTGVRRCGKSTLLQLYAEHLRAGGVDPGRIITINLEQLEYEHLLDYHKLHDEILARAKPGEMNYVFIDEVQNVPEFQRAVDSLYTRDNLDLYITGSNALMLRGTLATLLSGRYIEVSMLPLSFKEFCSASDASASRQRLYDRYISTGGMPGAFTQADGSLSLYDYLEGILSTVLFKDVAQRLNIANTQGLDALATYLFDNVGNLTSAKAISDFITSQGIRISPNTVSEYISGLVDSYIFYPAKRFDLRGKRLLKLQEKYYGVDMGMRRMVLSGRIRDTGRILENVVFLELKRRYKSVYIGKVGDAEVDFVVESAEGYAYYQVAETVSSSATLKRELQALRSVQDDYPKYLITMDDADEVSHQGISQVYALDWLLDDVA